MGFINKDKEIIIAYIFTAEDVYTKFVGRLRFRGEIAKYTNINNPIELEINKTDQLSKMRYQKSKL